MDLLVNSLNLIQNVCLFEVAVRVLISHCIYNCLFLLPFVNVDLAMYRERTKLKPLKKGPFDKAEAETDSTLYPFFI